MFTRVFWKATGERVIRGAAVAVAGAYFVGDGVFNALEVKQWEDVLSLALGGGFGSLVLSIAGGVVSGNGPAFNKEERVA